MEIFGEMLHQLLDHMFLDVWMIILPLAVVTILITNSVCLMIVDMSNDAIPERWVIRFLLNNSIFNDPSPILLPSHTLLFKQSLI